MNVRQFDRVPLPEGRSVDGGTVWELPLFCSSDMISEDYEKKIEVPMKHFDDDRAKV